MASRKITITLDAERVDAVRKLVDAGAAASVSGFVQHAVALALNDVGGWSAALGLALERTGGPLTKRERAWADEVLRAPRRKRSRAA